MISPQLLHHVRNGGIVAYPTSTLPGLACLPEARSLDALFELKQRPSDKPVSLGVLSLEQPRIWFMFQKKSDTSKQRFRKADLRLFSMRLNRWMLAWEGGAWPSVALPTQRLACW